MRRTVETAVVTAIALLGAASSFAPHSSRVRPAGHIRQTRRFAQTSDVSFESVEAMSESVLDVLVCGAGPGGLLLASQLAQQGCSVGIVDPGKNLNRH